MHKDIRVADIAFSGAHPIEVKNIENQDHMPPYVADSDQFIQWLDDRNMPSTRPFAAVVMDAYGIMGPSGFAGVSHNASLTDCYWFADPEEIDGGLTWNDVSFWNNAWGVGGEAVFSGRTDLFDTLECPDFATPGTRPKTWIAQPDNIFLLKRDGSGGLQTFAEILASEIAGMLSISYVPHFYSVTGGEICTGCPCAVSENEEMIMIPVSENIRDFFQKAGFGDEYARLLCLDFLMGNPRVQVYAVRDPDTLAIIGMVPAFGYSHALQDDENLMRAHMAAAKQGIRAMEGAVPDRERISSVMRELSGELGIAHEQCDAFEESMNARIRIFEELLRGAC